MTSHLSPILTLRKKSGLGVLKQFSTSVTWIGLPLFFLFYPILLGFLPANLRWTMFVFTKVNTALYPVSIPAEETAAKI